MRKRLFALLLSACMVLGLIPSLAFAADHEHDDSCGYAAPSECSHIHDNNCGYVEAVEGVACGHSHDAACGYREGSTGTPCDHVHGDCGYAEASPCTFTPCDHSSCGYVAGSPCNGSEGCDHLETDYCGYVEGVECPNAGQTCDHSTCGYTEGSPCNHTEHMDCGYSAPVEGTACNHTHNDSCGYKEAVEAQPCTHEHDAACGYSEGSPCTYVAPTTYTVTYTDGVDGEEIFPDMVYNDIPSGEATPAFEGTLTRDGFTFAGWSPEVAATVTGDATYTAQWTADAPDTPATYTVTFYPNGGTGTMSPQTFTAGVEQSLTPNTYTREGYFFLRWNTAENGGGQGYTDGQSIAITENLTLYALWHQHTYGGYIYTDGTGHYQECTDSVCPDANKGRTATEPHTGDINSSMGCTVCHYSTIPLTVSISPTYLINGGTVTITTSKYADQVTTYRDYTITTSDHINWTATIPGNASARSHFTATAGKETVESESFYLSPTFWIKPTEEVFIGGSTVTLVTAVPVSSVTCDTSGITVQGSGDEWTATLPNSTATYTFTATLDNHTATCTVSVVKGNTITFHGNSGSGSMEPIVVKDGEQVTLPACSFTAPDGFTFAYWSTKANGAETQYESGKILKPSADMTLYAIWKAAYVTDNSTNKTTTDTTYKPITIPVTVDDTVQVSVTVTKGTDSTAVRLQNLTAQQFSSLGDGEQIRIDIPSTVADTPRVTVRIPSTVIIQLSERTDADLQIATGVAEVNIASDALAKNAGELVMEARRTEDGISTKVSIGGVSVIDTSVMLFVSLNNLPEDGKLVVSTLQPGVNDLNFLLPPETTAPPNVTQEVNVEAADIQKRIASTFTGPGEVEYTRGELLLIDGKEYYLYPGSGSGKLQLLDMEGILYDFDGTNPPESTGTKRADFPEKDEYISVNGAVYQVLYSERDKVVLYMDGKIVGEYLNSGALVLYGDDYHPDRVKERQQLSGIVTTGENPIDGLVSGKTYNVSVVGSQDISVPGYDEAVLNSIKAETEEEKAAREKVERLKADMEAKEAAMDQYYPLRMDPDTAKFEEVVKAWHEAREAYEAALAELAALANLQSATVTQTFDIPNELVGRTDVTFVAVHNTDLFPVPGSSIRDDIADFIQEWRKQWEETYGSEIGTVEVSEDGQTLTATYTVSSFSPFTIYAFTEA